MTVLNLSRNAIVSFIGDIFDSLLGIIVCIGFCITILVDAVLDLIFGTSIGRWLCITGIVIIIFKALSKLVLLS